MKEKKIGVMAKSEDKFSPIAIVGMACKFPKAETLGQYWANIAEGVDAITDVPATHWKSEDFFNSDPKKPDHTYNARGGFIPKVDFDPLEFGITPNALEATDTTQLLGLIVAKEALENAGYGNGRVFDRDKVSVILGITGAQELVIPLGARLGHPIWRRALKEAGVQHDLAEDVVKRISESYVGWQENSFPGLLGNVAAGRIANRFDFGGTNCVVDAACASSLSALHLGVLELHSGRSDMIVTGGIDTFNDIFMYMCFSKTPVLSQKGDARPFDINGDGTVLGEGIGLLVLKRLEDAEKDGDRIYAVIKGLGSSSDGKGNAIYMPSSVGQSKALRKAYSQACVTPDTIELVEAHGTGTKVGDATEVKALIDVYRQKKDKGSWCAIGSVKSQIGHTKAAAGIAGMIKTAMALHNKVLPPTIKVENPIPELTPGETPFFVNTEKKPWVESKDHPRRAAISAFGFGGSNFHCLLEEYDQKRVNTGWDLSVEILPFSGNSVKELRNLIKDIPISANWQEFELKANQIRKAYDPALLYRMIIVVENGVSKISEIVQKAILALDKKTEDNFCSYGEGIFYGKGNPSGKLGIVFSGQGSQYVGMYRDLACGFSEFDEELAKANLSFSNQTNGELKLSDFIYPHTSFSVEYKNRDEAKLRETNIAQPAIGAVSLAAFKILEGFGVKASAFSGHSFGELTALSAAGVINQEDFYKLSAIRGKLMKEVDSPSGAMLAVKAELLKIKDIIGTSRLDLVVANKNSPTQYVLSGGLEEIDRASALFKEQKISSTKLPVSGAFHSRYVSSIKEPFRKVLSSVKFSNSLAPVFSNSTANEYPEKPEAIMDLLSGHLAMPVEFVSQIENMYEAGITTFLEVGPGNRLSKLIKEILKEREINVLSLDASAGTGSGFLDLARSLAHLSAVGHNVNLEKWKEGIEFFKPQNEKKKVGITIPICGANYVKPKESGNGAKGDHASLIESKQKKSEEQKIGNFLKTEYFPLNNKGNKEELMSNRQNEFHESSMSEDESSALVNALQATREHMKAMQKMQENTAKLHQQFLSNQEQAQKAMFSLMAKEHDLLLFSKEPQEIFSSKFEPVKKEQVAEVKTNSHLHAINSKHENIQVHPITKKVKFNVEHNSDRAVLEVISEKTGYPRDALDLDMAMDADLGIDSIKQVEILSALQEKFPDAQEIRPDVMGSIKTLRDLSASFKNPDSSSDAKGMGGGEKPFNQPSKKNSDENNNVITQTLLEVISEKTGYPVEMLEMDMSLDADLGIDSIKQVEILSAIQEKLPNASEVKPDMMGRLNTLKQLAEYLDQGESALNLDKGLEIVVRATAQPAIETSTDNIDIKKCLLEVISEKTGYPIEMLEMDMALDADLGIDSIKQVEILSAIQEKLPHAPEVKPDIMGTLRTLSELANYLGASNGNGSSPHKNRLPIDSGVTNEKLLLDKEGVERSVLLCHELNGNSKRESFKISEGSKIWITDDGSSLSKEVMNRLKRLNYDSQIISPELIGEMDKPGHLGGLIVLASKRGVDDKFMAKILKIMQVSGEGLRLAGKNGGSLFVTVSRLDGAFGLNGIKSGFNPISGGLAGFTKTASHEWPEVKCKAIDLSPDLVDAKDVADKIVDEMFLYGPIEVGLSGKMRCYPKLEQIPFSGVSLSPFNSGDTILVTGGARGVTAEVSVALATTFKSTIVMIGRSRLRPEPNWISTLLKEADIKKAIMEKSNGHKLTPKEIEKEYLTIAANREIVNNISRIEKAGGKAVYKSVDVRSSETLEAVIKDIEAEYGEISGLIHGAGILHDRLIEDKTEEQFENVYSTKVQSLRTILSVLGDNNLKALVLFSSFTGRHGRAGQVDYAVANEVLNKIAQQQARLRKSCRVISVNWGPWDGGMVTPSLKKIFEKEGVSLIDPKAGADYLIKELCFAANRHVEIVIMGTNGVRKQTQQLRDSLSDPYTNLPLSFETLIGENSYLFLDSHRIKGRPVLPMAMMIELMAHGAIHLNPGLFFHGFNGLRVLKGVILENNLPYKLQICVGKARKEGEYFNVPVIIKGIENGTVFVHAQGEFVLTHRLPKHDKPTLNDSLSVYPRTRDEIYNEILFHGPFLQGIEKVTGVSDLGIECMAKSAPLPSKWIVNPIRSNWLSDPLLMDSAFQLMILWSYEKYNSCSLPCFVGKYRQFVNSFQKTGVRILASVSKSNSAKAVADIYFLDGDGNCLAMIDDYECVIDESLNESFSIQAKGALLTEK